METLSIFITCFLVLVAPIWIVLHYSTQWRSSRAMTVKDERILDEMSNVIHRMEGRMSTVFDILDADIKNRRS